MRYWFKGYTGEHGALSGVNWIVLVLKSDCVNHTQGHFKIHTLVTTSP